MGIDMFSSCKRNLREFPKVVRLKVVATPNCVLDFANFVDSIPNLFPHLKVLSLNATFYNFSPVAFPSTLEELHIRCLYDVKQQQLEEYTKLHRLNIELTREGVC